MTKDVAEIFWPRTAMLYLGLPVTAIKITPEKRYNFNLQHVSNSFSKNASLLLYYLCTSRYR